MATWGAVRKPARDGEGWSIMAPKPGGLAGKLSSSNSATVWSCGWGVKELVICPNGFFDNMCKDGLVSGAYALVCL